MSRWFRHYAGMMRDEKLVKVAVKSKQTVERVVWIWGAILESAAEINDAGRYEFDAGEAAYFLRCDEGDILCVVECLESIGRLHSGVVARWSDRQFDSDSSKERQRRYRERLKAGPDVQERNGDVGKTSRDAGVTAQEAETETDTATASDEAAAACAGPDLDPQTLENKMRDAAGDRMQPHGGFVVGPVMELVRLGADVDLDVIPTIRAVSARMSRPARSWDYFVPAIQEAMDRRKAATTWDHRAQAPPGQKPPSAAMQRHERIRQNIKREIHGDENADSSSPIIDLSERDYRPH